MKILHISTARTWRGGEQQIAYLLDEVRKLGVQQAVFCPVGSALEAHCLQAGFEVFSFKKRFNLNPLTAWKLGKTCRRFHATHLHVHDSPAHTLALLASNLHRLRLPVIVHRRVDFPIGRKWFSTARKYNHPSVRRIICVSDFIRELIKPKLNRPDKLVTIHSGIDLQRFHGIDNLVKTNRLRSEYHIPESHFVVANIAAIAPHKDYFTFVKTAELLVKAGVPATFLAIGANGGEEVQVRRFIQEKKLEGRVILTGFRKDMEAVLPEIDLLLFTSKTEGLGTSLLDAFACGVPVVATAAGGIPEVVEHGVTGLLCQVGDAESLAAAVSKVLTDPTLRSKLVANARLRVQDFTKEKMAAAVLEVYQQA